MHPHTITTDVFQGPLELLIELVEKRKLLINDISLAEVTDEYIARVGELQERSLTGTSQFVVLAATLLLIKSKSLLPELELTDEEEASIDDLEVRLRRLQIYKDAAAPVAASFGRTMLYGAQYAPSREPLFVTDGYCTIGALQRALGQVLDALPAPKTPTATAAVKPAISLEQMMLSVLERVERQCTLAFSELRRQQPEHKNIIVSFLAILELCKQGDVLVLQHAHFADISIETEQVGVPMY